MTEPSIHHGLEGIHVARTRLSEVDGENGALTIAGYPVEELAPKATFEQVLGLLWDGEGADEGDALATVRALPEEARTVVEATARAGFEPMDALRASAASLVHGLPTELGGHRAQAREVVARLPTALAAHHRLAAGLAPVQPTQGLGHAANLLTMLEGREPSRERARALETYMNTVSDHGLNASTFTARVIVSTGSDIASAVTGAIGALKGPLHGGAPGPVLDMLEQVHETGDPEAYVQAKLEAGERIMGFGHRVYKVRDPRAEVLSAAAERFYKADGDMAFFQTARRLEQVAVEALAEAKPGRRLETNVEFYTALLLHGIGIARELFTPLFAVARSAGWTAHCLEQIQDNRLIRPSSVYDGPRFEGFPGHPPIR